MDLLEELQMVLKPQILKIEKNIELSGRNSILQGYYNKSPVAQLVEILVDYAEKLSASDIHFEPQENYMQIRFRVDGLLLLIYELSAKLSSYLISYLKLMAGLDIAEKRLPQDGSILYGNNKIDIRISVIPVLFGEKAVLRLLGRAGNFLGMEQMGFTQENLSKFKSLLHCAGGIITITGPVNSGKSTLLYAALDYLNKREVNIVTIEDPIEMKIEGINQMQINLKAGMSFAVGLKAVLRQDPDIVMVGEIRDEIVAKEAVRAALTGHLILTTLHTANALGVPARLINMGVNPAMLSITLLAGTAQRLVRKICPRCKEVYEVQNNSLEAIFLGKNFHSGMKLYRGTGCEFCHHSGYAGRIALHEIMTVDDEIRAMLAKGETDLKLQRMLRLKGMKFLYDDGITKVMSGITTVQEVWRVLHGI